MGIAEPLEPRQLLAGPAVVALTITGTEQEVTGVVLTFSDPLDPATAQNRDAYFLGRDKVAADHGWDPLGLGDRPRETDRIQVGSATYDDANRTVTLTPAAPFNLFERLRRVRISGRGETAVRDVVGVPLDGNRDGTPGDSGVVRVRVTRSERITYRDVDGDRVKLKLVGPGKLWGLIPVRRDLGAIFFLNRSNLLRSGLLGWVVPNARTGDGQATIRQLSGTRFASLPLLENPSLRVEILDP